VAGGIESIAEKIVYQAAEDLMDAYDNQRQHDA